LVQVVMGVHEPRSDEGAGQAHRLVRLGWIGPADGVDAAVRDEEPAAVVLRPLVVHRHDVRLREEKAHACKGTSSKRSTSTSPRSVIFRLGITESARNESVRNG